MRTKPHTVRFDSDKLELALKKAETDKVQKMVDEAVDVFLESGDMALSFKMPNEQDLLKYIGKKPIKAAGQTIVKELDKEGSNPYNPMDNPRFKSKNKLK